MTTFTDDFNRADSTNLGASWVEVSGDWSIISQQLSSGSAGGTIILRAATAMATNDHYAQITIAATSAVSHGVWCRGNSNISQGYLWRNDGTSWVLFSVVGGSFTSIGSYAAAAVAGDVAKVQAVGSTIKGFVNGVQRVSVTDTSVATGTSVGLRAESTSALRFDDFSAGDVTTGATGDAALTGTATLSTTGVRAAAGNSALTATATLSAAGLRATAGDAALTATASLTTGGLRTTNGDAPLTTTTLLAADGTRSASGAVSLEAAATLTADGVAGGNGSAALTAAADLAAFGLRTTSSDTVLTATAALTADGTVETPPTLTTAGGNLTATAALEATATTQATSYGTLAVAATLTAAGSVLVSADDVEVTVGSPYSPWTAGQPHATVWTVQAPHTDDWEVGAPW